LNESRLSASMTRMSVGGSSFKMKFSVSGVIRLMSDSCEGNQKMSVCTS
jgi:hypothetical protein